MAKKDEKIRLVLERGELLPDDVIIPIVRNELEKHPGGFILDGTPRNLSQAKKLGFRIDHVIYLDMSDDEVVKRLSSRLQCRKCRAIYGKDIPPKAPGKCDKCGGELYHRDDDKPDAIGKRLKIFHEETTPVIKYYEEMGVLRRVEASGKPDDVFSIVMRSIDIFK
ncbi:MAG: nucleoside monophosphate kinase [Candidatus Aenigmarchaeota archaeon]|nr:nucleoside monophosphate kinase [Candidatus Aenigmarchaeota archaeon]